MNENTYCIFAIHYTDNENSTLALGRAETAMRSEAVFKLNTGTYLVRLPDAVSVILAALAIEITSPDQIKNLHFSLIPCGSIVYGELPKELGAGLVALGLHYSETPIPRPLQQR